jgi:hypothetical protein
MTIDEIKSALVSIFGLKQEDLVGKTKKELQKTLDESEKQAAVLESATVAEAPAPATQVTITPNICDPTWTEYVLGLMTDDEKKDGMPRADGLRRIARKLLDIVRQTTDVVECPTVDNGARATVIVTVETGEGRTYAGAADVFTGNTKRDFAIHPVATAETRAEGRALRKALCLVKVLAAEELDSAPVDEPNGSDERIVTGMLNVLNIMASRVGVDLLKLALTSGFKIERLEDLTKGQGVILSDKLAKIGRGELEKP